MFYFQIADVKVNKYYTRGLRRFNSPAFLEFAQHVEPEVRSLLTSTFSSVVDVQVVRILSTRVRTITLVSFAVLVDKKDEVVETEIEAAMYDGLKNGKLSSLHATDMQLFNVACEIFSSFSFR